MTTKELVVEPEEPSARLRPGLQENDWSPTKILLALCHRKFLLRRWWSPIQPLSPPISDKISAFKINSPSPFKSSSDCKERSIAHIPKKLWPTPLPMQTPPNVPETWNPGHHRLSSSSSSLLTTTSDAKQTNSSKFQFNVSNWTSTLKNHKQSHPKCKPYPTFTSKILQEFWSILPNWNMSWRASRRTYGGANSGFKILATAESTRRKGERSVKKYERNE